jgi:alpha-L-arabinofuranosidase
VCEAPPPESAPAIAGALRLGAIAGEAVFSGAPFGEIKAAEGGDGVFLYDTAGDFTLKLKAKGLAGNRGFLVCFGGKDRENFLCWSIGGARSQAVTITSTIHGRPSCLARSLFTVESGRAYDLLLEVRGGRVRASIDGALVNEAENLNPAPEPLYYSAALDSATGEAIVKCVNIKDDGLQARFKVKGLESIKRIQVTQMAGFNLDDENSFAQPRLPPRVHTPAA